MRSIYLLLFDTTHASAAQHLRSRYQHGGGDSWLLNTRDDDTILYIRIEPLGSVFIGEEEQARVLRAAAGRAFILVAADVSGRHHGDEEVRAFVADLLSTFEGVAFDDYTDHAWTLSEIQSGIRKDSHPFFDYDGWYRDRRQSG